MRSKRFSIQINNVFQYLIEDTNSRNSKRLYDKFDSNINLKTCHFGKSKSSVKCTRFNSCHEYFNVSKLPNLMSGEIVKMFFDLTNLFIRDSP